jgi:hypothetical protein
MTIKPAQPNQLHTLTNLNLSVTNNFTHEFRRKSVCVMAKNYEKVVAIAEKYQLAGDIH